jgi:serine protease Do
MVPMTLRMDGSMRRSAVTLLAMLLAAPVGAAPAPKRAPDAVLPDPLTVMERTEHVLAGLGKRVSPAVVNVRRFVRDDAWWQRVERGTPGGGWMEVPSNDQVHPHHRPLPGASGFLMSADGYILTVRRAVVDPKTNEPAPFVDVDLQQQVYPAQVVSLEPTLDLAILKIDSPEPLPFLRFGDSGKSSAGHWAIAFGDPDGAQRTMLPGFVMHSPARECYQDDMTATYMQLSTMVPDGALGGPVVNLRGEVIGVSTRLAVSGADTLAVTRTLPLALPSNIAGAIFQAMLMRESKESPWLGISVLAPNDTLRKKLGGPIRGIYIDNVFQPSPASKLGVRIGDVLATMDDKPIVSVHDFQRILYELGAGSRVRLGLIRDRKPLELVTTIERRPPEATTH